MKILSGWIAIFFVLLVSCDGPGDKDHKEIEVLKQKLDSLEADQATMKILVGNKDFYPEKLPFKTNILLKPQSFKMGFLNKEGSNVEMELIRENWFIRKPISFSLSNGAMGEAGGDPVIMMIGKLTDKVALQGEGYLLVNGKIEIPELSRQLVTIVFEGNLIKPGQASTVENYIPVKGWIVVKEPDFSDGNSAELLKKINEK